MGIGDRTKSQQQRSLGWDCPKWVAIKKTGTETLGQLAAISDQLSRIQGFTPPKVPKFVYLNSISSELCILQWI